MSFDVLGARNVFGVFTVTNSTLTNSDAHGINIENYSGTLSDVVISNNALTGDGPGPSPAARSGSIAQRLGHGRAPNVTKATLPTTTSAISTNTVPCAGRQCDE